MYFHERTAAAAAAAAMEEDSSGSDDGIESSDEEDAAAVEINHMSLSSVLGNCPDFRNAKSTLRELVDRRGHKLILSPTYHAELAGVGIEYDFGRVKWNYRRICRHSTKSHMEDSAASFGSDVVSLALTWKFARRARDYMRAYRAGAKGFKADLIVKKVKTHR